ncbi:SURF1 family protein [Shewanella intestini]|uniref:SURF1-like protein n=1 Tax=Shewanella intestini TaxID=2017544 RepID=A0ABS5I230_9GAMM|nr:MULTISPECIES: SURF1 family protein [Shewanella]MBR9728077.1 SURF1 family protein [Shewanella intestini]MRG36549.1 SURF1 family protein [Shewanella sp. XMDDZSB0408]
MNMSSSTSTNLTINGVVTGSPLKRYGGSIVIFIILTVAVFSTLVKLGLWQLSRAEQKAQWQQSLNERQKQVLNFKQLLSLNEQAGTATDDFSGLSGYQLTVIAQPVSEQILLLDNQVYQGTVGYLAYQIMSVSAQQPWILVELGFIAANKDRRILPNITPITTSNISLSGRIYQKQLNPVSDQLLPELGNPLRFQNLNIDSLSQLLGHPILPTVIQPNQLPNVSLPHPWQPIPLPAKKHQGYALQWFSMAAVFIGLMAWIAIRFVRRFKINKQHLNAI